MFKYILPFVILKEIKFTHKFLIFKYTIIHSNLHKFMKLPKML